MDETINNYMKNIKQIPELVEIESNQVIKTFIIQFITESEEYMQKNNIVYYKSKVEDCISENLMEANKKNKDENENVFEEYSRLFPKENMNNIAVFIDKYLDYFKKIVNIIPENKSYMEIPKNLEKEIMKIIERENYHNYYLIKNYDEVKIYISNLTKKCFQKYIDEIIEISNQLQLSYLRKKSEILIDDINKYDNSIKSVNNKSNILDEDIFRDDYEEKNNNLNKNDETYNNELGDLPGNVIS